MTADAVWNALPFGFPHVLHSRFAGEEAYFPIPALPDIGPENHKWETAPGDIGFFSPGSVSIYYGRLRVITPGNTFAHVTDNWEGLYRVCKATWKDHFIPISVERVEEVDNGGS
jgi:hypothetical protein